jgi:hypothetical protein
MEAQGGGGRTDIYEVANADIFVVGTRNFGAVFSVCEAVWAAAALS